MEPASKADDVAISIVYVVPAPPPVHERVGDVTTPVERSAGELSTGTEGKATSVVTEIVGEFEPSPATFTARTR